jgi:hypothetical protein
MIPPGVVDEQVDPHPEFPDPLSHGSGGAFDREILHDDVGVDPVSVAEPVGGGHEDRLGTGDQYHVGLLPGEFLGEGGAETGRGSGDKRRAACEADISPM